MGVTLRLAPKEQNKTAHVQKPDRSSKKSQEKEPFLAEETKDATPAPVGNNQSILVADDNPIVLKAFELKLKASGFNVTTTSAGAAVASTAETVKAELIILDVNFAEHSSVDWSGFTVMQWLGRFPELAKIPVILITGSEDPQYQEKALAAGAVGFLRKPIDFKELLSIMAKALGKVETQNVT